LKKEFMNLKTVVLIAALALVAQGQTTLNLTSGSVLATINYAQDGSPKVTGSVGYLTPLNSDSGTVSYSFMKVVPVALYDAAGKFTGFAFQTSVQTDVWQRIPLIIGKGKAHETTFAVCGGGGIALTGAGANGAVNTCGVVDIRMGAHIALTVPIYGQYVSGGPTVAGGWMLQPSVGVRYSFKAQ
jgi:hypothetical protein